MMDYTIMGFWAVVPEKADNSYWGLEYTAIKHPYQACRQRNCALCQRSIGQCFRPALFGKWNGIAEAGVSGQGSVDINFATGAVAVR
jgi:hypothetical protein